MCILAGAYEPGSSYAPGSRYPSKMGIIIRGICNTGHDHTYLVETIIGHIKCEETLYKTLDHIDYVTGIGNCSREQ